eukprot:scaffold15682_cov131-Isochrysis_galbana.AAC.4
MHALSDCVQPEVGRAVSRARPPPSPCSNGLNPASHRWCLPGEPRPPLTAEADGYRCWHLPRVTGAAECMFAYDTHPIDLLRLGECTPFCLFQVSAVRQWISG